MNEVIFIDEHFTQLLVTACVLLVEIAVRLWPTTIDRSLVNMTVRFVLSVCDYLVPNKGKRGNIVAKVETVEKVSDG